MINISIKKLYLIGSVVQAILAIVVSQYQSYIIKKEAKTTKNIQLSVAIIIFIISLGQTMLIIKKIKSNTRSN
ncbi:hypothetical protein J7E81_09215 [Bacillus sp. ISL-18]|uniref:hypothetical protein n=1 Tax=Bacillus sp. ISL-18 TaxID=2819118 RepID=UPI001BEB0BBB|nr:hypothetical protein [Bacillus sp. ISL-18]MBT2655411.1 hypothetical protein [Bacillus sp. ISL-18]